MRLLINEALDWPSFVDVENESLAYALDGEPVAEPVSSRSPAARTRSISVPAPVPMLATVAHTNAEATAIATATAKLSTASAITNGDRGGPAPGAAPAPGTGSGTGAGKVQRMVEFIFDLLEMRFADTPLLVRYALCYITLSHYGTEMHVPYSYFTRILRSGATVLLIVINQLSCQVG